ncbi:MAG: tetraacyldisaccharide 4'-kinase [Acidobacteriota bacterium]|nr:tetraacyldisaccharide 4'-kinase [Acidobacteriota bacterium]
MAPLVPLYAAGASLRARMQTQQRLSCPVVSIGNLSTGGAGKTPLAIYLAQQLAARGFNVDVLSRGYGRASSEPMKVDPKGSAKLFGDEPLLIAQSAGVPVYVAPRRFDAGQLAERELDQRQGQPQVHILDDGFQHRQLARDVDILILSDEDLDDSLLPAGNLREALSCMQRASVVAIPADSQRLENYVHELIQVDRSSEEPRWIGPIWRLKRQMDVPELAGPVFAFCGIARPEQFFTGLERTGVKLAETESFRDHHSYSMIDLADLARAAYAYGATALITTEKDRVRLGDLVASLPRELPLLAAKLSVSIEDETAAMDWLVARISAGPQ